MAIGKVCLKCGGQTISANGACKKCGSCIPGEVGHFSEVESLARKLAGKMLLGTADDAKNAAAIVADAAAIMKRQKDSANVDGILNDTDGDSTDVDDSGQGEMCPECGNERLDSTGTCPQCGYIKGEGKKKNGGTKTTSLEHSRGSIWHSR